MTSPTAYVGLLRGINVGKARRMPLAEPRAHVSDPARLLVARSWATALKIGALLDAAA